MYAVTRSYSGKGASELVEALIQHKDEIKDLLRPINGFVSWTLVKTDGGGISVTICQDKSGTDQSVGIARDWIKQNLANLNVSPPVIMEGPVALHFD